MNAASPSDAVTVLLEDFRVHHQALLQLESEVGRWTTVYAGALTIGAAASFTEAANAAGKPEVLGDPIRAAALLMLATVNAVYILAVAFKGYQCQLLRLYLHDVVGRRLRQIGDQSFYGWEIWQRTVMCSKDEREGKLEAVRFAFYAFQTLVPLAASGLVLGLFFVYSWPKAVVMARAVFVLVAILSVGAAAAAFSTTKTNAAWRTMVGNDRSLGAKKTWAKMCGKNVSPETSASELTPTAVSPIQEPVASRNADAAQLPPAG